MGLQHPDHQFKSGCRLSKSDVVVYAMMSDFFFFLFLRGFARDRIVRMKKTENTKKRYDLIDTLRGLEIISMIAFHTCWLMCHFGMCITQETLYSTSFTVWERSICIGFIMIAGFSFSLGRRHLKSGLIVFGWGIVITAVTCIFLPEIRIVFGVLTLIGSAILLTILPDREFGERIKGSRQISITGFVISLILFILTYNINIGYLGFKPFDIVLPKSLYSGYLMTYIGFMEPGFISTDYFSILPWIFVYLCGYFLHKITTGSESAKRLISHGLPGIKTLGRHSLPIYLIHPIVIYALLYFISGMLQKP